MNDCIIGYLFVSLSIFYFLMKSRQEILALLRDFKVRKGKKYGILKMRCKQDYVLSEKNGKMKLVINRRKAVMWTFITRVRRKGFSLSPI